MFWGGLAKRLEYIENWAHVQVGITYVLGVFVVIIDPDHCVFGRFDATVGGMLFSRSTKIAESRPEAATPCATFPLRVTDSINIFATYRHGLLARAQITVSLYKCFTRIIREVLRTPSDQNTVLSEHYLLYAVNIGRKFRPIETRVTWLYPFYKCALKNPYGFADLQS